LVSQNREMKVLCPKCNQTIALDHLEEMGDQMEYCKECNIFLKAIYDNNDKRLFWRIEFEKPLEKPVAKKKPEPKGGGCGTAIWILVALFILLAMIRCDWEIPPK
jgi:hypothetical protein